MFSLYRLNGTKTPERIEFFEKLPKITASFKEQIKTRHGSGAFYLQHFSRKGEKTNFVIPGGINNKQGEEMDSNLLMALAQSLQRIESKQDRIIAILDDLELETDEPGTFKTPEPATDPLAGLMTALSTNPEASKLLAQFGGIDAVKKLAGL